MYACNYKKYFVMGIAGNTPGHLAQVGETEDFENISTLNKDDPKCIFPIYSPNADGELTSIYPLSTERINIPTTGPIQLEPEMALICDVQYSKGKIISLIPQYITAFNDCSIRIPDGNEKISRRKNWGINSKGISKNAIKINDFSIGGCADNYKLCSFLIRDNTFYEYTIDTYTIEYSFFNDKLIEWIVETINNQKDERNIENVLDLIKKSNYPKKFIISIGATKYTEFGEVNNLKCEDRAIIVLYDGLLYTKEKIFAMVKNKTKLEGIGISSISLVHYSDRNSD